MLDTVTVDTGSSDTMTGTQNTDVIIAGGGLAGLSLAKQLLDARRGLSIVVVEHRQFPIPATTAKIGESTVEIGAHYFTQMLGLGEHFQQHHLRKQGLRCFFGRTQGDYAQHDELGVSQLFGLPTYQIERGVLENHLYDCLSAAGVRIVDGTTIDTISLGQKQHRITLKGAQGQQTLTARWIIDAAGRRALIKNTLGLNKANAHRGNAVWFRIDRKIVIDQWSQHPDWQARIGAGMQRWLSTNHLMGPGYWVWIIPLGSGATSIGIVMDDQAMADSQIDTLDDALRWLQQAQPQCAAAIAGAKVLDFGKVQDYSYDCQTLFCADGWGLSGEAAAFIDPFYSPGSDFIAIHNTLITQLILRDQQGQDIRTESALFNNLCHSFLNNTLSLYTGQYGGFGDRRMMSVKLLWDYAYYWGVLSLLFFRGAITDIALIQRLNPSLRKAQTLNQQLQAQLVTRAQKRLVLPAQGLFLDQYPIPCLQHFTQVLQASDGSEPEETARALAKNVDIMATLQPYLIDMLSDNPRTTIAADEREFLGNYRLQVLS
ncbi:MAG: tryptophan 7-halogenase [Cellvibrionaceae bacterium]|nr:tryptophan 7-halogenase [Cellvibrionaceae bacterium]